MTRRLFVAAGLALLSFARRAWAQLAPPPTAVRYAPLTRAVSIPLAAVEIPWHAVPFVAEARLRLPSPEARQDFGAAGAQERRVLISGVLFRTDSALSALCVTCPHEQCQVDLVTDEGRLSRMTDPPSLHPLFECGCHFSVFDAANEGARVSGETPRGLYRFRLGGVNEGMVTITEIEAAALSEV